MNACQVVRTEAKIDVRCIKTYCKIKVTYDD